MRRFQTGLPAAAVLLAALAIAGASRPEAPEAPAVLVSAAASLTDALRVAVADYEARTGERVLLNVAASSSLANQIIEGAPADVFFSADEAQMDRVAAAGRLRQDTRMAVLSNRLVIVVPRDRIGRVSSVQDLLGPDIRRVAVADPAAVPAGVYARHYLESLGLWAPLSDRIVPAGNVRAVLAAVEAGTVDAGFVYRTDAATSRRAAVAVSIPLEQAPVIRYPVALVKDGPNPAGARRFLRYLQSARAAAAFERHGFIVPTPGGTPGAR